MMKSQQWLHPIHDEYRQETIRLVKSYTEGRYKQEYGFTRKDISYLTLPSVIIIINIVENRKPLQKEYEQHFKVDIRKERYPGQHNDERSKSLKLI